MNQIKIALAGAVLLSGCMTTGSSEPPVAEAPPAPQFARTADGWLIPTPKPSAMQSSAPAPNLNATELAASAAAAASTKSKIAAAPRLNTQPIGAGVVALDPNALVYPKSEPCHSVTLFSQRPIQDPDLAVPKKWRKFLGHWGNGAWDGIVCHDIRIVDVRQDGTAEVVSMHAPYEPWGQFATAYTRNARFVAEDKLLVSNGTSDRLYWIGGDGRMRAVRTNPSGYVTATLVKKRR